MLLPASPKHCEVAERSQRHSEEGNQPYAVLFFMLDDVCDIELSTTFD